MKIYFELQFNRINRLLAHAGIKPLWGWIAVIGGVALLANILFKNTEYASVVVLASGLQLVWLASNSTKIEFLILVFGENKAKYLRLIEGQLMGLLFLLILMWYDCYVEAAILWVLILFCSISDRPKGRKFVLPTPFCASPFEFSSGFRNSILGFILVVGLLLLSLALDNPQMGLFAVILIFLICANFYSNPEGEFFVWIYNLTPRQFLWNKMGSALINSSILAIPVITTVGLCNLQQIQILIGIYVASLLFLSTIIVAKYAAFPRQIQIPEGVLLAISMTFPPLLLVLFPYFFKKAIQNLKFILHDNHQRTA